MLRDHIIALSGQNAMLCFQCSKCSAGCPLSDVMDLKPAQVMHRIHLNQEEAVLNSQAIWLCVGCEACAAHCPQQVEPAAAMAAARLIAFKKGIKPSVRAAGIYYRAFVDNMRLNDGKIHDISLTAIIQLLTGQLIGSIPLAWKLLIRGRLKPPPFPIRGRRYRELYHKTVAREKEFGL